MNDKFSYYLTDNNHPKPMDHCQALQLDRGFFENFDATAFNLHYIKLCQEFRPENNNRENFARAKKAFERIFEASEVLKEQFQRTRYLKGLEEKAQSEVREQATIDSFSHILTRIQACPKDNTAQHAPVTTDNLTSIIQDFVEACSSKSVTAARRVRDLQRKISAEIASRNLTGEECHRLGQCLPSSIALDWRQRAAATGDMRDILLVAGHAMNGQFEDSVQAIHWTINALRYFETIGLDKLKKEIEHLQAMKQDAAEKIKNLEEIQATVVRVRFRFDLGKDEKIPNPKGSQREAERFTTLTQQMITDSMARSVGRPVAFDLDENMFDALFAATQQNQPQETKLGPETTKVAPSQQEEKKTASHPVDKGDTLSRILGRIKAYPKDNTAQHALATDSLRRIIQDFLTEYGRSYTTEAQSDLQNEILKEIKSRNLTGEECHLLSQSLPSPVNQYWERRAAAAGSIHDIRVVAGRALSGQFQDRAKTIPWAIKALRYIETIGLDKLDKEIQHLQTTGQTEKAEEKRKEYTEILEGTMRAHSRIIGLGSSEDIPNPKGSPDEVKRFAKLTYDTVTRLKSNAYNPFAIFDLDENMFDVLFAVAQQRHPQETRLSPETTNVASSQQEEKKPASHPVDKGDTVSQLKEPGIQASPLSSALSDEPREKSKHEKQTTPRGHS